MRLSKLDPLSGVGRPHPAPLRALGPCPPTHRLLEGWGASWGLPSRFWGRGGVLHGWGASILGLAGLVGWSSGGRACGWGTGRANGLVIEGGVQLGPGGKTAPITPPISSA